MNYIKEAENYLRYYHDLYKSLENINRQIARLIGRAAPREVTAICFDETGIKSGRYDETLNTLFELQKLVECREETQTALSEIDKILEEISREPGCELYGQVLRKWYIEKKSKEEIAEELGYSSRQSVYDIKNRAIRIFAVRLFGLGALKAI
ncbi:RNA polymerase sigma factor, region 3/4 [Moorella glycerini]|uniref:Uncharacterized protein n=1 Tax=Neomoorella stamsii TaxID=1266720 RepID=A0A9X7J1B4_9FIRM|nr:MULTISPECIES: hypothetical protein [Moorella]PRR69609.1 hypothetical protein MOST_30310 [Moorella stamsii]CEP67867.1 RNA polymerase sigma factor, region 3/4 [Moorella glycerini]CEP68737.1 RNA polymerase sigma factor, region 3/4 [Moorella glycerini]